MERLTEKYDGLYYPQQILKDESDCREECMAREDCDDTCAIQKCFKRLAEYEGAEEEGRLIISKHKIGDKLYAIVHDDICNCYDVSDHIITDICMSGTIVTDVPVGDSECEVWTLKDQKEYHVCFSEEEVEEKLKEMEEDHDTAESD